MISNKEKKCKVCGEIVSADREAEQINHPEQRYAGMCTGCAGEQRLKDNSFGGCVFEAKAEAAHRKAAQERFGPLVPLSMCEDL